MIITIVIKLVVMENAHDRSMVRVFFYANMTGVLVDDPWSTIYQHRKWILWDGSFPKIPQDAPGKLGKRGLLP